MKKFIGRHRKIISLMGVLLAAVIISVMTFGGVVNDVIAGVFKGEKDKDKIAKDSTNKVVILEIVPQYGQQILGYTIPGYEPITKEAIEAYPVSNGGRLDPTSAEFKNATGWVVKEASGRYYVTDNVLEDAFNANVLAESMDVYENAEIELIVKQANDVVAKDITNCDLIYVNNPIENDVNLLYYYDQIMNYDAETNKFSDNVQLGNVGAYYDSVTYEDTLAKDLAMRLIRNAAGRVTAKELETTMSEYFAKVGVTNTRSIFEIAGLKNYYEYNSEEYIEAIETAEKGSISEVEELDLFLAQINASTSEEAKNRIYEISRDVTYFDDEANKEEFKKLLKKTALADTNTGLPLYVDENFESYVVSEDEVKEGYFDRFKSMCSQGAITMESSIYSTLTSVNGNMSNTMINVINGVLADASEERVDNIKNKLTAEIFIRLNYDITNELNTEQYVEKLCKLNEVTPTSLVELITKVNENEKNVARRKIAEAAGNETLISELTHRDFAVALFEIYEKDFLDKYKEALIGANKDDLINVEVIDMPVYTEDATSNVIVHFKSSVDWESRYVTVEYLTEGATDYVALEDKVLATEDVNGYYRVVLGAMPEGVVIKNLRLTFSNVETVIGGETPDDEGGETPDDEGEETPDAPTVEKFSLTPIEIIVPDEGTVYGEYWCVYDPDGVGKVFTSAEDIKNDATYGDDYAYAIEDIVTFFEENMLAILKNVNDTCSMLPGEVTYDFYSWDIAKELYRYSTTDESGLVFNTEIIKEIGGCKYDSDKTAIRTDTTITDADRTNLVYKALMAIKLYAAGKFSDSTLDKIDEEGLYYTGGIASGVGVDEWTLGMFGGDSNFKIPLYSLSKRVFTYANTKMTVSFNGSNFINYNYDINMNKVLEQSKDDMGSYGADFKRTWKDIFDKKEKEKNTSAYGYHTLGDILRYTMNLYINELYSYPLRVLEIQPVAQVSDLKGHDGAKKIADWLRIDYSEMNSSNYKDYISVKTMSVREFNTQNKDLTAEYDVIYFGIKSGNLRKNSSNSRTVYNDSSLNGCVYTSIGDEFTLIDISQRGMLWEDYHEVSGVAPNKTSMDNKFNYDYDDDYYHAADTAVYNYYKEYMIWAKYFTAPYKGKMDSTKLYALINSEPKARSGANDITVKKSEELIDYLKSGHVVLLEDEIMNADRYVSYSSSAPSEKWTYVDFNSKLYHFVQDAKALGYDEATATYTGKDSKGNNVFADGGKYASLVSTEFAKYGRNPENLPATEKFNGGLSYATKRNFKIDFEYKKGPKEYDDGITAGNTGNVIDYKVSGKVNKDYLEFEFILGVPEGIDIEWIEENYGFQVHVDKSGLGRFTEENTIQLDPDVDFDLGKREIKIVGDWPKADDESMGGFIPWRLEVYMKDNPNSHYVHTGYSAFEKIDKNGNPKTEVIEVLYIKPKSNLHLDFYEHIVKKTKSEGSTPAKYVLPEYTINCTTVSYRDFANNSAYWPKDEVTTEQIVDEHGNTITVPFEGYNSENTRLKVGVFDSSADADRKEKEFNMIVFGYCDSYVGMDIDNINTLRNIDYFVGSGHSLIFSHDNAGEVLSVNNYRVYEENGKLYDRAITANGYIYAKYTTSYMRAMLGMDLYGLSYPPEAFIYGYEKKTNGEPDYSKPVDKKDADENTYLNPDFVEAAYNARLYIDTTKGSEVFRGVCEGSVFRKQKSGSTYQSPFANSNGTGGNIIGKDSLPVINKIRFVNKGQITMYPYVLGDEGIPIYNTHFQYQALNLEDDDMQVWATFESTDASNYYGVTSGDGSNNYYIYTKGNITYSGTGHSESGLSSTNDMERKLFLNTVVAAIKAGNYGPEIKFTNSDAEQDGESVIYSYDSEEFVTLKFKVSDVDSKVGAKGVFSNVDIYFDKIGDTDASGNNLDDANPFYHETSDIILNDPDDDIDIMRDEAGVNKVNYTEENIENKVEYTIKISYADIATMYNEIHGISDVYTTDGAGTYYKNGVPGSYSTEIQNLVSKFFEEYRFAVTATDVPKKVNGVKENKKGITKSAVARVAFRSLFDLN